MKKDKQTESLFKKSSFCHTDSCCVEVAHDDTGNVLVRHTEDPNKALTFSPHEWQAFIQGVKNSEFEIKTAT